MIKSITFKFGPTANAPAATFRPGPMTIIVGPNNSGKSLTLRELRKSLERGSHDWDSSDWYIIRDIEPGLPDSGRIRDSIQQAVEQDFGQLRGLKFEDGNLEFIFSLFIARGKEFGDISPHLFEAIKQVLALLSKRKVIERLVSEGKLRANVTERTPPGPFVPSMDMELLLRNLYDLIELFRHSHQDILRLVRTVGDRPAEALVQDGLVNLRGYFEHIKGPVAFLDGTTRLSLLQAERTNSVRSRRTEGGLLMALRNDRTQLERLRKYVLEAFGKYAALDILDLHQLKLVLSDAPLPPGIEDSLDDGARAFFRNASDMEEFSDGVRSYIGLHARLLGQECRYAMLDEPEAFLHPPLARRLGANLTSLAAERGTNIFAATHSPDFVMGCLSTGHPVNIVRLGFKGGRGSARILDPERLADMMEDPLVRSTGALSALFHEAVVLCEGPSDRVFYSEINDRLVRHDSTYPRRMQSCLFMEVGGKDAIPKVFEPLLLTGVPIACVIDLDLLNSPHILSRLLKARGAHDTLVGSLTNMRGQISTIFKDRKALLKQGGIEALTDPAEREALQFFIDDLARFGIFLPERGEVESWLPSLGCLGVGKSDWLPTILEKMGKTDAGLKPAQDDVWKFLLKIATWLDKPLAS